MQHPDTERILTGLADGIDPHDIAADLVDRDVARGDYKGCSSELEMAFGEYESAAQRILADVTP